MPSRAITRYTLRLRQSDDQIVEELKELIGATDFTTVIRFALRAARREVTGERRGRPIPGPSATTGTEG